MERRAHGGSAMVRAAPKRYSKRSAGIQLHDVGATEEKEKAENEMMVTCETCVWDC